MTESKNYMHHFNTKLKHRKKFYNDQTNVKEESNSKGKIRDLFKTTRDITDTFTPRIGMIKGACTLRAK